MCFVIYEYLINFDYEVHFLWMRRFTYGSCLFFLCRYLPIAQISLTVFQYLLTRDISYHHCRSLGKACTILVYLQYCLSNGAFLNLTLKQWSLL
ncbi:hypothetical protein SCHPADRAFT_213221 [Schizopora paradoxa]|uniref:DUF6533 domain-containing protein n=1 Tax=Schizopora paradoxa TaxID=27342 RepID=A0A0H2RWP2_9AGAM|nr:hypothetical protein SCHPADRAFT_213221 [Schizopora paradoxa]